MTGLSSARARLALFWVSCVSLGCGGAEEPGTFSVADSAGIRIVINVGPQWGPGEGWRVNPEPSVDIGAEGGDPDGHLYQVRDAVRWQERIVVINGVTDDLRVFDLEGSYQRTIGRQGGGPGEFDRLSFLRILNQDSLITWDFSNDRVSVFDAAGQFVRSTWLERNDAFGAFLSPTALLADRRLLTVSHRHMAELGNESGRFVDSSIVALHEMTGSLDTILGLQPSGERMRMILGDRTITLGAPFARELQIISWLDGYCLGFGTTFELHCQQGFDGASTTLIRLQDALQPVTQADVDAYVEEQLAVRSEAYGRAFRRMRDHLVFRDSFPAFRDVKADPLGNLWVAAYGRPGIHNVGWIVIDSDGRWLGTVDLPGGFELFRVYEDALLGVWKDSLDVEHVRLHALIK